MEETEKEILGWSLELEQRVVTAGRRSIKFNQLTVTVSYALYVCLLNLLV